MEDMLAAQLDDWLLSQALDVAEGAKGICILAKGLLLVFSYALLMQTRWMHSFVGVTIAWVAARQILLATFSCLVGAFLFPARGRSLALEHTTTEPALFSLLILLVLNTSLS
jgi:hypothetical protein